MLVPVLLLGVAGSLPCVYGQSSSATVSTAVANPSASAGASLPSQAPLPPKQDWCPSEIFCAGALLQTVNLAALFPDDKTFIDKPTNKNASLVLADFASLPSSPTVGDVEEFVNSDFGGEGLELEPLNLAEEEGEGYEENPPFLGNVTDPLLRAWAGTVHGYWAQLVRGTKSDGGVLCDGVQCESSLIPLNHTFVVPGGRFREQYYWDSFWIVEGLLESRLFSIVNATLQNFMDEIETIGFIPNGGRIYYLNRSQPPLFIQMLARYVTVSGDNEILTRALPLAEKEMQWWRENRYVNVTSPTTNETYEVAHYDVTNSAPRPESYLTDYETANNEPALNESERSDLYAELATGAESGWDFTSRWFTDPKPGNGDLRTLQVRSIVPVELNSILYKNHIVLSQLSTSESNATFHREAAASLRTGILDLLWNSTKLAFYDFNLRTQTQNNVFSAAAYTPYWSGITPDQVLQSGENALKAFAPVNLVLNRWNGTFPATFLETGLQWDFPNTWPPHQYIVLQALRALPANITGEVLPRGNSSSFDLLPDGQLGLSEADLPLQPAHVPAGTNLTGDVNFLEGTVFNGGNATEGEGWASQLGRELANRYFGSAFCSWRATGGSIDDVLPRLSDEELGSTGVNGTGNMFEKFSSVDFDSAGRGGEYVVQAGFGWTNGVVLWVASVYGDVLVRPECPDLLEEGEADVGLGGDEDGAVGLKVGGLWLTAVTVVGLLSGLI